MKKTALTLLAFALVMSWGIVPAMAYNCPASILQAEEWIVAAEALHRSSPHEMRAHVAEAKKLVAEAKEHHEKATGRADHAAAIRKARTAQFLCQEAVDIQLR